MSTMTGRSMAIGQGLGVVIALYAFVACGDDPKGGGTDGGSGGTNPQGQGGTDPQGQGGTDPQGQDGTDPQGQGGTDPHGQGGTDPQGQGGTEPQGQGGTAGLAGSGGTGGDAGIAGAVGEAGAGGTTAECTTEGGYECPECDEEYVHVDCGGRQCVCERQGPSSKAEYEALLACDLDEPCPVSTQHSDILWRSWENGECLLEALRDRTPGRYRLSTSGGDLSYVYNEIMMILDGSDQVIVFDMQTSGVLAGNLTRQYVAASCTLKSFEELDACVTAGTDVAGRLLGQSEICTSVLDWTENCEILQNPTCPSE